MIVARLANSLRRQDWTTFAIEFVLVIAGVFVALEVDNWNQERVADAAFRRELQLLRGDLDENVERLAHTIGRLESDLTRLAAFQRAFRGGPLESDDVRSATFIPTLTGPVGQLVRSERVDKVLASDGILDPPYAELRQRLEDWNLRFTGLLGITADGVRYGSDVILPLFTESHSRIAAAERLLRDTPYAIDASGVDDELRAALADPRVESAIVNRMIIFQDILDHARYVDEVNTSVIAEIDRVLGVEG